MRNLVLKRVNDLLQELEKKKSGEALFLMDQSLSSPNARN
jgi:hypothetical protein